MGDLKHDTIGKHSVYMPIGIGYIASYALAQSHFNELELRMYTEPNELIEAITDWKPSVLALSNYCWNNEISRTIFNYAKKINHNTVCVAGGPEFPDDLEQCEEYLSKRPDIDFYIYLEGEIPFLKLIKKIVGGSDIETLKSEAQEGVMSIHPKTCELVVGGKTPRIENMDIIPSPFLNGLMDKWFDGYYAPMIETARGCPFSCSFCYKGQPWFSRVGRFSTERINDELTCIAKKMKNHPNVLLCISDANFAMYERDERISDHLKCLQDEYGWPNAFNVTTGKANFDRIIRISAKLDNKIRPYASLQSLNPETLKIVKRKNIPTDLYLEIQAKIQSFGQQAIAELIIPLPGETKTSFFKGMHKLINSGLEQINVYTAMILKGTEMASKEWKNKYGMKTKWRILPRQFGEYCGEKVFEVEEVCIATNAMPFNDYLECRGFTLVSQLYLSEQFDVIRKHLNELEIDAYEFIYYCWEIIKRGDSELSEIYDRFISETMDELWDSKEDLDNFFSKQDNYAMLLAGDIGDNLLRKYNVLAHLENSIPSFNLAYKAIKYFAKKKLTPEIMKSLEASQKWVGALRNVGSVINNSGLKLKEQFHLPYDVNAWYQNNNDSVQLLEYKKTVNYIIYADTPHIRNILNEGQQLYGEDIHYCVGKLLDNWRINNFWLKCETQA